MGVNERNKKNLLQLMYFPQSSVYFWTEQCSCNHGDTLQNILEMKLEAGVSLVNGITLADSWNVNDKMFNYPPLPIISEA